VSLEEEKKQLVNQMSELSLQDPFANPDRLTDNAASDTEASEEYGHDRVNAILSELKEKLIDIDDALMRVGDGTYGTCEKCKNMIDTDRLSVIPTARYCNACEKTVKHTPKR